MSMITMTDARRPKLVLQGSIVTKAVTGAAQLSEDNWKEVLPFLSLGDQLRATTACCELVLNGRAFFGQQRSIPLRFAAANLGKGVGSLGGAGRFGALRYVNLGQIGLARLTPPILEILAASTSLEVATATVRLRTIAEVSASDQLARNCPKLRIQATLDLGSACPTPPFRALLLCCCFGACCLPPPPPLPPPSLDARFWLRGLTVSGGVC